LLGGAGGRAEEMISRSRLRFLRGLRLPTVASERRWVFTDPEFEQKLAKNAKV